MSVFFKISFIETKITRDFTLPPLTSCRGYLNIYYNSLYCAKPILPFF